MHRFPAQPMSSERLRTEPRHLRMAEAAAALASQHATRAWATYLHQVESGDGTAEARRDLDISLAQHAYAWAVVRGASLDATADVASIGHPSEP